MELRGIRLICARGADMESIRTTAFIILFVCFGLHSIVYRYSTVDVILEDFLKLLL